MIKILSLCMLLVALPVHSIPFNPWGFSPSVFRDPNQNNCSPLWKDEGSVCNGKEIVIIRDEMNDKLEVGLQFFKDQLDQMNKKLNNSQNRVNEADDRELSFYKRFAKQDRVESLKEDATQCVRFMKPTRTSSLCSVCSAKGKSYFFKGKAIMALPQCDRMLVACKAFHQVVIELIAAFVQFSSRLQNRLIEIQQKNPTSNWGGSRVFENFRGSMQEVAHLLNKANLIKLVQDYDSSGGKDAAINSALCARFYNLNKAPIIIWLGRSLSFINNNIGDFVKVLNRVNDRSLFSQSQARGLQELSVLSDQNLFASDVVVLRPQDNMFAAYDGMLGSSLDANTGDYVPMNLTLAVAVV